MENSSMVISYVKGALFIIPYEISQGFCWCKKRAFGWCLAKLRLISIAQKLLCEKWLSSFFIHKYFAVGVCVCVCAHSPECVFDEYCSLVRDAKDKWSKLRETKRELLIFVCFTFFAFVVAKNPHTHTWVTTNFAIHISMEFCIWTLFLTLNTFNDLKNVSQSLCDCLVISVIFD